MPLFVCTTCGTVIVNVEVHMAYHALTYKAMMEKLIKQMT